MKNLALSAFAALACLAGSAMGQIGGNIGPILLTGSEGGGYTTRDALGVFGARMAVFSSAGGAFYDDATGAAGPNLHNFGANQSMGLFQGRDIRISSSMTILPSGNQLITISAFTADTLPFVAAGTTLGGTTIQALQFDIGTPNAPADPVDFDSPISIVSATFTVASATTTFGPFASTVTTPGGNSLTARSGVSAPPDITGFGINRFDVSIELTKIPAPSSLALIGLGGLAVARRRR